MSTAAADCAAHLVYTIHCWQVNIAPLPITHMPPITCGTAASLGPSLSMTNPQQQARWQSHDDQVNAQPHPQWCTAAPRSLAFGGSWPQHLAETVQAQQVLPGDRVVNVATIHDAPFNRPWKRACMDQPVRQQSHSHVATTTHAPGCTLLQYHGL
jgi:hypothetical protein